jgi:hypothetical protein
MSVVVRRAAPLAAILACALPAPGADARPRSDRLVAQIAQATPTATPGGQPQLTPRPPAPLGTATPTPTTTATGTPTPAATATATAGGSLARTGSDAALVALAGLSLLGLGLSLRWVTADGAPV